MRTTTAPTAAPTPHHSSSGPAKTNYIVEHAAPSAVCLVRKVQTSPYQPLPTEQVHSVAVPNLLSLRPPPHVAHQAVMDFYFAINGHCGVQCSDPSALDLITVSAHTRSASSSSNTDAHTTESHRPHASSALSCYQVTEHASTSPSFATANNNSSGKKLSLSSELSSGTPVTENTVYSHNSHHHQQQHSNAATSSVLSTQMLPPTFSASSSEDYRLSQIRRNERHVNNAVYGKVCAFFNTREGCRRGPYCNYLHVSKGGTGTSGG